MDLTGLLQIIQTIGFPAAFCLIVLKMLEEERVSHKEEMRQMTEALNNNTMVLTKIEQRLDDMVAKEGSNE